MRHWRSSSAYTRGTSHAEWGTPCQDRAVHNELDGAHAIILADGAGSYEHSHLGAERVVTKLAYYLCDRFDRLNTLESRDIAGELHAYLHEQLNVLVLDHDRNKEEFSSTLLFVVTKGEDYIAGHVGDGIIVKYEGGNTEILSEPENGLYENETYFVSMDALHEHFRIYRGTVKEDSGFAIMSDGSAASFYSKSQGLDTQNLGVIIDHFQKATTNTFSEDLNALLIALIENTDDDCSIAVLAASKGDPITMEPSGLLTAEAARVHTATKVTTAHAGKTIDELLAPRIFGEDDEEESGLDETDYVDDVDVDYLDEHFEYEDMEEDMKEEGREQAEAMESGHPTDEESDGQTCSSTDDSE
ncbi:PP2C family serine/threonine-protein phosphatase [Sporosarcina sp. 179-K 3D1 HS]|uniref:PP2C family serine/threonine-protein phosphatase n=1 Tax=Sporosarcina sp. 179-K 3D1 HS TaxID=3232169 RepID=UPI0039A1EB76